MPISKAVMQVFSELFDYYPSEEFVNIFLYTDNSGIDVSKLCRHPFMRLSITYSFVWNYVYKTFPTKKNFVNFLKQCGYTPSMNIILDRVLLDKILNSLDHVKFGIASLLNVEDLVRSYTFFSQEIESRAFVEKHIINKLCYRYKLPKSSINMDDNIISNVIKIIRFGKKYSYQVQPCFNPICSSLFDLDDPEVVLDKDDNTFMTDFEKLQHTIYKDHHFFMKLFDNVCIYVEDNVNVPRNILESIIGSYESVFPKKHVILLNTSCNHDDLLTFEKLSSDIYEMLPRVCKHHVTISHNKVPVTKSLTRTHESSLYYIRYPMNVNTNADNDNKTDMYDRYITNSIYLLPHMLNEKMPLETYVIQDYQSYNTISLTSNVEPSNLGLRVYVLGGNSELVDKCKDTFKANSLNVIIDTERNSDMYDIVVAHNLDASYLLPFMADGAIPIVIGETPYVSHMVTGVVIQNVDEIADYIPKILVSDDSKLLCKLLSTGTKTVNVLASKDMFETMWNLHIKNNCPIRTQNPRNSVLLYTNFMIEYFLNNIDGIVGINRITNTSQPDNRNCVVLVDNRANMLSVMSVLFTMSNLNATWKCKIYTSKKALGFYTKWLGSIAEIIHTKTLDVKRFHIDVYNKLLMDPAFWSTLEMHEKCLIIQDDGVLLRRGIERFLAYDYVGAPWIDVPDNKYIKEKITKDLVGNGGFSLRTVQFMKLITSLYKGEKKQLFYNNINNVPEDVYFVKYLKELSKTRPINLPSSRDASFFSSEQIINNDCIGIHKVWSYHHPVVVKGFLNNLLNSLERPI